LSPHNNRVCFRRCSHEAEVYLRLREQLDQYSIGFPHFVRDRAAILERLFTEEEAEMFLQMS
jgi:hypothetical protein